MTHRLGVAVVALSVFASVFAVVTFAQRPEPHPLVTPAEYETWRKDLSNWGRWGKDDGLGALNLITPAKRKAAAALVRKGISVSLASDVPTRGEVDIPCPAESAITTVNGRGAVDRIAFPCIHGAGHTHIDSLAHIFFNGLMWNGFAASENVTEADGARRNSVLNMKNGIVTRGILYDIPRLKGVPYLEPGTRIFADDLEAWEKKTGVKAGAGDALVLRWGRWSRRAALGPWTGDTAAGLDNSIIPWLKRRDISMIVWETPGTAQGDLSAGALHNFALSILGVMLVDRADLEALSNVAAQNHRWVFMLTVGPLAIPNGTGSTVNPIAVF